jgi:XTP/dITP diphosphohydrolase
LNGAPGIYSARYAGEKAGYDENNQKLLHELLCATDRKAHFECQVVLLFKNGAYLTANGLSFGEILKDPSGLGGFGYDPLFYSYDLKKTFSAATEEEKNAVSHRGKALRNLAAML